MPISTIGFSCLMICGSTALAAIHNIDIGNITPSAPPANRASSVSNIQNGVNTAGDSFEGIIEVSLTRGSHVESYTYSASTNMLRVARNESDHPYATNLIDLDTGRITYIFPHNRSFMRLDPAEKAMASPAGFPEMPMPPGGLPRGIGPQADAPEWTGRPSAAAPSPQIGPTNLPGIPAMPNMPDMPADMGAGMPMPMIMPGPDGGPEGGLPGAPARRRSSRELQFNATDHTTNLLGYVCTCYKLRQRDRVMEVWATDQLVRFYSWSQDPSPRHHGPQMLEERWGEFLQARGLFPLWVQLKNESGDTLPFEFKVISVTPKHFDRENEILFQAPADYHELDPPPF